MTTPYWLFALVVTFFVLCHLRNIREESRLAKTLENLNERVTSLFNENGKDIDAANLGSVKRTNELDDEILKINHALDSYSRCVLRTTTDLSTLINRLSVTEQISEELVKRMNEYADRLADVEYCTTLQTNRLNSHAKLFNHQNTRQDVLDKQWKEHSSRLLMHNKSLNDVFSRFDGHTIRLDKLENLNYELKT